MGTVNIKDIAAAAGVSTSAVSIVLNDRKGVSEATRKKIKQVMQELNYTPNLNSRRLILQKSFNIYLVLDENVTMLSNTFYAAVLQAVVTRANQLGYNIVLTTFDDCAEQSHILNAVNQRNLDGIIFLCDIDNNLVQFLRANGTPFIVIDSHKTDSTYHTVRSDYQESAYIAANYLISKGHTRLGLIGRGDIPDFYLATFNGFKRAVEDANLDIKLNWIQSGAHDEQSAYSCMQSILDCETIPTAIFCAGDILAIGAMNCAVNNGIRVPEDISFCGLDNIILSQYCSPPLTTIEVDVSSMGAMAVELIDKMASKKEVPDVTSIASNKIIERKSVRCLSANPQ